LLREAGQPEADIRRSAVGVLRPAALPICAGGGGRQSSGKCRPAPWSLWVPRS